MDAVRKLADQYGLMIVEDAAQALGSQYKGQCAGTFGKFGTFSFYPAKVLGCFGDGGAIVTNDDEVAAKLYALRDHGRNKEGIVLDWGTNSRLDNLQAAFLDFKLHTYPQEIIRRREIAAMYHNAFASIKELTLPPAPQEGADHYDIYQNYELAAERRDDLRAALKDKGIHTIVQWGGTPVHHFDFIKYDQKLPHTDWFFERCFMLPMNTSLSDDDVSYIIDAVVTFHQ
jgi:dTDP-4-amino-4,6-dideoxygalactose transaminase